MSLHMVPCFDDPRVFDLMLLSDGDAGATYPAPDICLFLARSYNDCSSFLGIFMVLLNGNNCCAVLHTR